MKKLEQIRQDSKEIKNKNKGLEVSFIFNYMY